MAIGLAAAGVMAGGSLLGGYLSGKSAEKAAERSAKAQIEAARIAAEESRFRPVAVTTGFGSSRFKMGPDGRLQEAGYELTPELQNLRNQLIGQTGQGMGFAEQGLGAAQGMFDLGQQYMAQTPEQAAQQWTASQQAALAPGREQAMSGLMNRLAQTGTQGLGVAQAGGGMANPLAQAFANAQAQQDLELAARAQEQGRAQTQFGTGLFKDAFGIASGGYAPLSTQLQQAQGIEGLGQQALSLGSDLGGRAVNTAGAQALMQGGTNAARTLEAVKGYDPWGAALSGLSSNPAFGGALTSYFGQNNYNPANWSNPGSSNFGGFYQNESQFARDVGNMS
jgi:hypothetical protein